MSQKIRLTWLITIAISFFITNILAIVNSFYFNLKGGSVDAERFLLRAAEWIENGEWSLVFDSAFFIQIVGVYVSVGLGEYEITLIGISLYYVMMFFIFRNASLNVISILFAWFLLFSPAALLRLSALLREPYFIFALGAAIYILSYYLENKKCDVYSKMLLVLSSFLLLLLAGFFHKAVLPLVPFIMILFFILLSGFSSIGVARSVITISFLVFALALVAGYLPESRGTQAFLAIFNGDLDIVSAITKYKAERDFRATYDYGGDWGSFFGIGISIIKASFYYYFKPFVSDLNTAGDYYLFIENLIRFSLVIMMFMVAFKNKSKALFFVLFTYIAFNVIWAVGTANYGTGSRHHWSAMAILALGLRFNNSFNSKYGD